tara:strand:- start:71076 stop:72074 length:999 start_codon:yes stop_codon:yes gene_type:complete
MYKILRPFLFLLPPETAHYFALNSLKLAHKIGFTKLMFPKLANKPKQVFGLTFKNPVGIAAGLDKNGDYIDCLASTGVGFIEVGAVTPIAQIGNPKPRLFRLPKAQAIINRMGFNNKGVDYLVENLKRRNTDCIVGVNLGKNKQTPNETAYNDYIICLEKVLPYADFATVNISSPNTPGLRELQTPEYLSDLLTRVKTKRDELLKQHNKVFPLLVKIAPDLSAEEITEIHSIAQQVGYDGIIATNTTSSRANVKHLPHVNEQGGLSGKPVAEQSITVLKQLTAQPNHLPIISVGGIDSVTEANKRFDHEAALIQIYSGLIYHGLRLLRHLSN